jgi:hypothetical protein
MITATAALLAFSMPAMAGQVLTIETDHSQLVILPSLPGSIVIGNPTIADATVEGTNLFIHARAFGTTNLMVLDMTGKELAHFDVSVNHVTENAVAMFRGPARESYNCAPLCEAELQIGDSAAFYGSASDQTKKKIELATGTDTAKSEAPPAPQ